MFNSTQQNFNKYEHKQWTFGNLKLLKTPIRGRRHGPSSPIDSLSTKLCKYFITN